MKKLTWALIIIIILVAVLFFMSPKNESIAPEPNLTTEDNSQEEQEQSPVETDGFEGLGAQELKAEAEAVEIINPDENLELGSDRSYCDCDGTLTVCPGTAASVDCQSCCSTYHGGNQSGSGTQ